MVKRWISCRCNCLMTECLCSFQPIFWIKDCWKMLHFFLSKVFSSQLESSSRLWNVGYISGEFCVYKLILCRPHRPKIPRFSKLITRSLSMPQNLTRGLGCVNSTSPPLRTEGIGFATAKVQLIWYETRAKFLFFLSCTVKTVLRLSTGLGKILAAWLRESRLLTPSGHGARGHAN